MQGITAMLVWDYCPPPPSSKKKLKLPAVLSMECDLVQAEVSKRIGTKQKIKWVFVVRIDLMTCDLTNYMPLDRADWIV